MVLHQIGEATSEIHYYDNRKYQFVYIAVGGLVAIVLDGVQGGVSWSTFFRPVVLLGLITLVTFAPLMVFLQLHTRTWNQYRHKLRKAMWQFREGQLTERELEMSARKAAYEASERIEERRRRNPVSVWVVDKLL